MSGARSPLARAASAATSQAFHARRDRSAKELVNFQPDVLVGPDLKPERGIGYL
jgi:hypothetical protein